MPASAEEDAAVLGFHAPAAPGDPASRYTLLFRDHKVNNISVSLSLPGVTLRGLQAAVQVGTRKSACHRAFEADLEGVCVKCV